MQVASLVAREAWDPSELDEKFSSMENLTELRKLLPNSLKRSLLCCDIAWELMSLWFRQSAECFDNLAVGASLLCVLQPFRLSCFQLSLTYLYLVDDCRLRHGVVALMWQNFLLERFKAAVLLIEKTGRAPKEREARQQLQMSETRTVSYCVYHFQS